jgi:hypothetical protein
LRHCKACNVKHPRAAFGKLAASPDGLRASCRESLNAAQKERDRAAAMPPAARLESLAAFGTPMQRATVEALLTAGNVPDAAAALQLTPAALRGHLAELERAAAKRGWMPGDGPIEDVPLGYQVKGTSTLYGKDGEVKLRWTKTATEGEAALTRLLAALPAILEPIRAFADPVCAPASADPELLNVIPFGDPHFGMHAWHRESGENFNLEIAERELIAAVDHLIDLAPYAEECVIVPLGDTSHADGKSGTTTKGTPLDVDTRWAKVFGVIIRAMRRCVDRALEKHARVHIICVNGNHDDLTSLALSLCLHNFYEREPRVTVDVSPASYFWYRFGANLLGFTHGDKAKGKDLAGVMACDRARDWGETLYRYWYCGHIHHETVKEHAGVTIESFRTLAPKDAYHASHGYRAMQDMRLHVWHREFGKINEHHVGIAQVRARVGK